MHGRVKERTSEEKERIRLAAEAEKVKQYCKDVDVVISHVQDHGPDRQTLKLTQIVLDTNPEYYTMWNLRRQALEKLQDEIPKSEMDNMYYEELKFIEHAISLNTKCYWTWHHRKWIVQRLAHLTDWQREVKLCTKLLNLDLRNFHCWSYRRFVASHANESLSQQFDYTTTKIEQNFSNYSAWHQRSALLLEIEKDDHGLLNALQNELELVRQAVYTEPNDQSPWIYHRWLMAQCKGVLTRLGRPPHELAQQELSHIKELLSIEPEAKWPLLTTATMMIDVDRSTYASEIKDILTTLKKVDPARQEYYKFLETKV
eukprot:TRINITY_DN3092_c0_g1_i3.p1 TRINITY_DN3092_c0_g1~~TRINITY_DN3092_c0_g1_i3.p1  ORF type:complete len:315 (+),score=58.76 TRINITY_DN3092_c0_g1_i3:1-945(+)